MRLRGPVATLLTGVCLGLGPGPASAAPAAPELSVSAVRVRPGTVSLHLTADGLGPGATLADARVTVQADELILPGTTSAGGTASSAVRGTVVVLDAGGPMAADPNAVTATVRRFADRAPAETWWGLVSTTGGVRTLVTPTADRDAFARALSEAPGDGPTDLYDGITRAAELLAPDAAPTPDGFVDPRIVVLSDRGDEDAGARGAGLTAGLRRAGIEVDAVAWGPARRALLADVTTRTGGQSHTVTDDGALRTALDAVSAAHTEPVTVTVDVPEMLSGTATALAINVVMPDDTILRATTPVTFGAAPDVTTSLPVVTVPEPRRWRTAAAVAAVVAVFLIAYVLLDAMAGRTPVQRRLDLLRRYGVTRHPRRARVVLAVRAELHRAGAWLGRLTRLERNSAGLLDQAAAPIRPSEWVLVRVGATVGGALVLVSLLPYWVGLPLGGAIGFLVPNLLLQVRIDRRNRAFAEELPETLHLVVSSLRSGFTLEHAITATVRDGNGPVSIEMRRALSETRLGGELEDSLERIGSRTGNADMKWLVMAIRLQREVGGNLSEVLQTTADTMRERAQLRRSVRALSAEGRLSAAILMVLPLLLGTWMALFRADYIRPLWTEPLGVTMLVGAVVMLIVGGLWLRAVVKVEV